jgi:hypothetical protein
MKHKTNKERLKKFVFTATVEVMAKDKDDADIEILIKMDDHDILWELTDDQ